MNRLRIHLAGRDLLGLEVLLVGVSEVLKASSSNSDKLEEDHRVEDLGIFSKNSRKCSLAAEALNQAAEAK